MKTQEKNEKLVNFLESLNLENFYPGDYINSDDEINSFDELLDHLMDNNALEVEIIYYNKAMTYLMENDTSLQQSLSIASEFGFDPKNLNSEILASLLASENLRDAFYECQNEIESFFQELNEEEEN